jgi:hypothetical protein
MGEGLLGLLGLGESQPPAPASETQAENSSAFRDAIAAVNESLQSAITKATPKDHAALDADRSKLYEAYQVASSQVTEGATAGKQAMDRVMAAASSLSSKAASAAAEAAAAQQKWGAKEELYDEMLIRVGELEDAGHPKADTLRQLTDTIREKANGRNYSDSAAAVDQLEPKLAAIIEEQQALIAQIEAAKAATNGQQGSSWWDKTTDAVSEWFTPGDDEKSSSSVPTSGTTGPPAEDNSEEKSWWDKAKEAVTDVYTNLTGDDGEQAEESAEGDGSDDGEVIGGDTATLTVQVNFSDGNPASGAPVFCEGEGGKQVSVDDSGSVSVKLPPGTYTVRSLWGASRAQQQVSLAQGNNSSVTLTLGHKATLNVTVRSANSGEPVANAIVEALGTSGTQHSTADSSGATSMVLEPGEWIVRAKPPETGEWGPRTGVTLTEGELHSVKLSVAAAGGTEGKVDSLKIRSQNELALKSQMLDLGYKEADNIADYNHAYNEVTGYLDLANKNHDFQENEITWWSNAIAELSFKRRSIAGRRASELHNKKIDAVNSVAGLRRTLASQKTSLGNIQKAFQNADNMQEGVSVALALKDNLSTLEDVLTVGIEKLAQQAVKSAIVDSSISELVNRVDPIGDAINRHVATLAGYVKKQAAQLEGYESMESLVRQISGTISAIRSALSNLDSLVKKYKVAVSLEATPG